MDSSLKRGSVLTSHGSFMIHKCDLRAALIALNSALTWFAKADGVNSVEYCLQPLQDLQKRIVLITLNSAYCL